MRTSVPSDPLIPSTDGDRKPDIAMWGAPGSGKTAFLAALSIALNRASGAGWLIVGDDEVSNKELIKMRATLLTKRTFPVSTEALTHYNWVIIGPSVSRRRRWWPWRTRRDRATRIKLDFLDSPGDRFAESALPIDKGALVKSLVNSRGLIYIFDPDREKRMGDTFSHLDAALLEVAGQLLVGDGDSNDKLPHHVAVCITKYDEPTVLLPALDGGFAERNHEDELRIPLVPQERTREFFRMLCREARDVNAEMILDLIDAYFHRSRVGYFVTSSIGVYVDHETGHFDRADFMNVIDDGDEGPMIRGAVRPINVMEPVLWLGRRLGA